MTLMTPGPTPVPEKIRLAMAGETLHHRTPEFEAIFGKSRELLGRLFGMDEVLMLAATGTGAMEATVINLCRSRALTVSAGKFGQRFGKIAAAFGKGPKEIVLEWDTPASVEQVMAALEADGAIDALFIQACESAGGLRHPVEAIAKAVKGRFPHVMVVVDGITAVGVEPLDTAHIDALITGSQKALMLPPGLAMIGLSKAAVAKIEEAPAGYYFNLASELKSQRKNTTAYTAATTLITGLGAMLEMLFEAGIDTLYADTKKRHDAGLEALRAIGLSIYPKAPALAMLTVGHDRADEIRKIVKNEFAVNMAGGQDHLKGKIFRINNMGLVAPQETAWALNGVEMALQRLGERPFDGTACRIFTAAYFGAAQ